MKTNIENSMLVYDDNCPACSAYTSAFVKGGLLQKENRVAFSKVNMQQFKIDWQRAKNEIPLVDISTGEVKYGVEALAEILSRKFSFIKQLMKNKWLNIFFHKLYKLISVNRKIIVAKNATIGGNDCSPDYNYLYRWLFIAINYSLAAIFIFIALHAEDGTGFHDVAKNFLLYFLLITFLLVNFCGFKTVTDVHGHLSVMILVSSFLFLFAAVIKKFLDLPLWCYRLLILIIVAAAIKELFRRHNYLSAVSSSETQHT